MTKAILIVLSILVLSACDYYDSRLKIVNTLDYKICFDYDLDTILDESSSVTKDYILSKSLDSGDSTTLTMPGSTDMWIRKVQFSKDTTLSIFVLDYNDLYGSDWDSIRKNQIYVKRLDLKLANLNNKNWRVEIK